MLCKSKLEVFYLQKYFFSFGKGIAIESFLSMEISSNIIKNLKMNLQIIFLTISIASGKAHLHNTPFLKREIRKEST